jgi:hypothetical protein
MPYLPVQGTTVKLRDELHDTEYIRGPGELEEQGLYVELGPWQAHVLDISTG